MKNVLELIEQAAKIDPGKVAFAEEWRSITYGAFLETSRKVGSSIAGRAIYGQPIAIYLEKGIDTLIAMMGVVFSGNIYTVIDVEMPVERIEKVFSTLRPAAVITDENDAPVLNGQSIPQLLIRDLKNAQADPVLLDDVRARQIDTDPLYILYTSGSTGVPKGTVVTHRNVLAYSKWVVDTFDLDEKMILGNQTPFYFSMSVTDIYATLRTGGTLVIIPRQYFTFPVRLTAFLNAYRVNTIYWVPSAYQIAENMDLFAEEIPIYLKTALFAGEVMPVKYLNYWIRHLGDNVLFANLFGPTETTDICSYYIVDREFQNGDSLPIGRHCDNCDVFLVNERGEEAGPDEAGELYVRGAFLAAGYYNDPQKTEEAFVQNPLNRRYPERCYKTGDLVKRDPDGNLLYLGRKDHQIKRMGYRIELGEIEAAALSLDGVQECACVFEKGSIVLWYSGDQIGEKTLQRALRNQLNAYLLPDRVIRQPFLPHNQNGKIDRTELKRRIENGYGT